MAPIFEERAVRILSSGGGPANFTYIIAPPLKSIPYLIPPFMAMLINPAAVSTREAMMNGHFLPRKSKFVFLNNSIRMLPCRFSKALDTSFRSLVPAARLGAERQAKPPAPPAVRNPASYILHLKTGRMLV